MFFEQNFDFKSVGQESKIMVYRRENGYWYWESRNVELSIRRSVRGFKTEDEAWQHACSSNYLDTALRNHKENILLTVVGLAILLTFYVHWAIGSPVGG